MPNPQTGCEQSRHRVVAVIYEGLCTFEFGIAVEVFGLPRPEFGFPWYEFTVASAERPRVRAVGGVTVEADAGLDALDFADTIIIPGWRENTEIPPKPLLDAVSRAHDRGARLLSLCSGVFVLAAAGLLNGRRATTHWRHIPDLKRLYPEIMIEPDVLYVDEGGVISAAGSTAGLDACMYIVKRDHGSRPANLVARRLVMPPHRDGGQAQYVSAPVQIRPGRALAPIMDWARAQLDEPLDVTALANRAAMSKRTFLRRFQETVGMTPKAWLQHERMVRAQTLLETGEIKLDDVAAQCGYKSLETFRAAFKRIVGTSPAAYRARFRLNAD